MVNYYSLSLSHKNECPFCILKKKNQKNGQLRQFIIFIKDVWEYFYKNGKLQSWSLSFTLYFNLVSNLSIGSI